MPLNPQFKGLFKKDLMSKEKKQRKELVEKLIFYIKEDMFYFLSDSSICRYPFENFDKFESVKELKRFRISLCKKLNKTLNRVLEEEKRKFLKD